MDGLVQTMIQTQSANETSLGTSILLLKWYSDDHCKWSVVKHNYDLKWRSWESVNRGQCKKWWREIIKCQPTFHRILKKEIGYALKGHLVSTSEYILNMN